jgi:hypothetical protein
MLAIFAFPFISSLFAIGQSVEANIPACCRRNGKHQCVMNKERRLDLTQRGVKAESVPEKCPCWPGVAPISHPHWMSAPTSSSLHASLVSHPNCVAQTESKQRISRDRSRQKRGPPALFS